MPIITIYQGAFVAQLSHNALQTWERGLRCLDGLGSRRKPPSGRNRMDGYIFETTRPEGIFKNPGFAAGEH